MTLALVTLEDRRAVYALLDRYLDWLPPTRLAVGREASSALPGSGRWRKCETCGATGRVAGVGRQQRPCRQNHDRWPFSHRCRPCPAGCEQGWVKLHGKAAETGRDPMLQQVQDDVVTAAHVRAEHRRWLDAQLVAIAALERQRSGEEAAPDDLTRAHDARERLWRTGSFRELDLALGLLALTAPLRLEALRLFRIERQFAAGPEVQQRLDEIVDWLAARMRRPLLLPADAQAELAVWKHSLEHGRTAAHVAQRQERDRQLVDLVNVHGWSLRRAGRVFDLSHERVRVIVAQANAAATSAASGPA